MYCHDIEREICNDDFRLQFCLLVATTALVRLCQLKPRGLLAGRSLAQYFYIDFAQNVRIQILKGDVNKDAALLIPGDLHQHNPEVNVNLFLETVL